MNRIDTILFDLDKTLFDHKYSLERTIAVLREEFSLQEFQLDKLISNYDDALQEAFDRYLANEISYEEKDLEKVKLFYEKLGLPILDEAAVKAFLKLQKKTYQEDLRATPGSIETLIWLRENAYKIGVVTNGQEEEQMQKLKRIGVLDLVDAVIISGEVGYSKPSPEIFDVALSRLNSEKSSTIMVGDSIKSDIEGALNYGIGALLYNPYSDVVEIKVGEVFVKVICGFEEGLLQ